MKKSGLYDPINEHDSCGIGFVVDLKGRPSRGIISDGLKILYNLVHRGGVGGDEKTGDGAGILVNVPHEFFLSSGIPLPESGAYGTGFLFLPQEPFRRKKVLRIFREILASEKGEFISSRDLPLNTSTLGSIALSSMPYMQQVFVSFPPLKGFELERRLYILRKLVEKRAYSEGFSEEDFYIVSLSSRTIIYKGMLNASQLKELYPDLSNKRFKSPLALVHQRYSTNTFPSWSLAQPFRRISHNGEINTLKGNKNYMLAREGSLSSAKLTDKLDDIFPIIRDSASDSAAFDNVFELLSLSGRSPEHSIMMMIPEAFGSKYHISEDKRAFYEYHAAFQEPWDGPAALAFTDGIRIGAALDRNGLRPARYTITSKGRFILASEVGVLPVRPEDVVEKGRLGPGRMIMADLSEGRIKKDNEIKASIARRRPYRRWLEENRIELKGLFQPAGEIKPDPERLRKEQVFFGYTLEDIEKIIIPMALNAQEPVGSMGDDSAPAVFSHENELLFRYFKQLFAQVTNPPIDPYRESLVMSLMSYIGKERNLLDETPEHVRQLKLSHPILTVEDISRIIASENPELNPVRLNGLFKCSEGEEGMRRGIRTLTLEAEKSVREGASILIISDRGVDKENAAIPSLMAVSAVNRHLIRKKLRHLAGVIVETGEAKEVNDFALLIGYGASAVNPYLAFETLSELIGSGRFGNLSSTQVMDNYITAVKKGLLKILSKMGISTIRSYKGAGIFEAVGLDAPFMEEFFPSTRSSLGGAGFSRIADSVLNRHRMGFLREESDIPSGSRFSFRRDSGNHLITPSSIVSLHRAVRENSPAEYRKFADEINNNSRKLATIRGLFEFVDKSPVPIEEVESAEEIINRFYASAMSFGSISKEAHESIAFAMNTLNAGGSNSGEGGEDSERLKDKLLQSRVKQVASGRFGVNADYLINARELQIKMAQGAKPGEGGQLPGGKVDAEIARIRNSTPGVMLISPPPHHDIYSIEDLSQLIYDLKSVNPSARVSVKLVSEAGVGTVAAGVAKGQADMILISGGDGGTGAAPLSSIKGAGIPWEVGISETRQTLILNKLRDRVRLQADGQMRTGRDIVIAGILGADEFGFGTALLLALGCVMVRKCHLNTCPAGIATQDKRLRERFKGKPEHIINYLNFLAEDIREIMAALGIRKFNDLVGRTELLEEVRPKNRVSPFSGLSLLLQNKEIVAGSEIKTPVSTGPRRLDELIMKAAPPEELNKRVFSLNYPIRNSDRTVGGRLSGEIADIYGSKGLKDGRLNVKFTGSAGQSFGAFLTKGVSFELEGEANDYLGKGLSGGRIILYPEKESHFRPQNNIIAGNVSLFGSTSGEVFIRGMAGERFAVRNSGAVAVVEGVGDHGCEYMTGGVVLILGNTGVNFAAGMSGGVAYVLDESQLFDTRCNLEMVDIEPLVEKEDIMLLERLLKEHLRHTSSRVAEGILRDRSEMFPKFVKVMPVDYRKALQRIKESSAVSSERAAVTEEVYG